MGKVTLRDYVDTRFDEIEKSLDRRFGAVHEAQNKLEASLDKRIDPLTTAVLSQQGSARGVNLFWQTALGVLTLLVMIGTAIAAAVWHFS